MTEQMSKTDAVLYVIDRGKATIDHLLTHDDAEMRRVLRREWLITVGATLDTARREIERLASRVVDLESGAAAINQLYEQASAERDEAFRVLSGPVPGHRRSGLVPLARQIVDNLERALARCDQASRDAHAMALLRRRLVSLRLVLLDGEPDGWQVGDGPVCNDPTEAVLATLGGASGGDREDV